MAAASGSFEQRDMEGALFKNERKTQENQPDFQGKVRIEDVEWWISAWVNTARGSGKQYLKLKISEPRENAGSPVGSADAILGGGRTPPARDWGSGEVDDDIPF
jgi:hypothetical protein